MFDVSLHVALHLQGTKGKRRSLPNARIMQPGESKLLEH